MIASLVVVSALVRLRTNPFPVVTADTTTVPSDFKGVDPIEFVKAYASIKPERDQFETTAQYKGRIKTAIDGLRFGDLTAKSLFAFVPEKIAARDYDADGQKARVIVRWDNNHHGRDEAMSMAGDVTVLLRSVIIQEDTYQAQNGFGAGFKVMREKAVRIAVAMNDLAKKNKSWVGSPGVQAGYDGYAFTFPMPGDKARDQLDKLSVVFLSSLDLNRPTLVEPDNFKFQPTTERPLDLDYQTADIRIVPREIMIFDSTTGEVVWKHEVK